MKKLLTVLFTLILALVLMGCESTPQEDVITRAELEELELRIEEVESYLSRMVWQGYLLDEVPEVDLSDIGSPIYLSIGTIELMAVKETDILDKTKFPEYIFDEFDNYVSADDLGNLLSQKYFGVNSETTLGFQYKIKVYKPIELSNDEFIARLVMMIMELAEYDFYTLDSPEIYLQLNEGASMHFKIKTSLLTADKYDINPAMFWEGMLDIDIQGIAFNKEIVEIYYNEYIASGEYDGLVLDDKIK